jgi:tRNA-dihydrouridine synthase A
MTIPPKPPDSPWALCVAPMMDWTDRHCRFFHRLLAPHARLYTEMVVADAAIHGPRERLLGFSPAEHPVALQLGGSDPAKLAQAAGIGVDFGYDEINLNVGCPSDRVQAGRFGACLMKEPTLVAECIAAMQARVSVPVTVKCRLGVDELDAYDDFRAFIDTVATTGCRVFIVHARKAWLKGLDPKQNREIPPLWYDRVYRLKAERPELSVVLNGGLTAIESCDAALRDGLDGVMLGRAAYHTPRLLQALEAHWWGTVTIDDRELLDTLDAYLEQLQLSPRHLGRHLHGYVVGARGAKTWRRALGAGLSPRAAWQQMLALQDTATP